MPPGRVTITKWNVAWCRQRRAARRGGSGLQRARRWRRSRGSRRRPCRTSDPTVLQGGVVGVQRRDLSAVPVSTSHQSRHDHARARRSPPSPPTLAGNTFYLVTVARVRPCASMAPVDLLPLAPCPAPATSAPQFARSYAHRTGLPRQPAPRRGPSKRVTSSAHQEQSIRMAGKGCVVSTTVPTTQPNAEKAFRLGREALPTLVPPASRRWCARARDRAPPSGRDDDANGCAPGRRPRHPRRAPRAASTSTSPPSAASGRTCPDADFTPAARRSCATCSPSRTSLPDSYAQQYGGRRPRERRRPSWSGWKPAFGGSSGGRWAGAPVGPEDVVAG